MSNKVYNALKDLKKDEILRMAKFTCEHGHSGVSHPECYRKAIKRDYKIGILDIESSGLKANFAKILSYCIKDYHGKILGRALTPKECLGSDKDKILIEELVEDMKKFDRIVTFYGAGFDIPFIRTRAVHHGIDFPSFGELHHTDLYFVIKHKFKLHSSRLQSACDFFNIPSKGHKMDWKVWEEAMCGEKKALDFILTHNKEDVISTELLFDKVINFTKIKETSI
jgi:uncharacterized protein YprB with RNaseH-like and TPR domain